MKKYYLLAGCMAAACLAHAQVIPNSSTAPSSVTGVHGVPSAYEDSMKVNFIRSWDATRPFTADTSLLSFLRTVQEVKQTTQYFDGLGRPLQIVAKQVSPGGRDMVSPVVYDEFGREVYKYLPYVAIDSNTGTGLFKRNPFNEQASFYSNASYNPGLSGEQVYYSKTMYEASPLNRVDTSFAPGNSWGGSHVGIVSSYQINTLADSVRIWNIDSSISSTPTTNNYYSGGQLYKNVTKDEQGNQVVEYKDKEGKVILKKVQLDGSPSAHHSGWLCTYYIYDDLSNLRCVIQPRGVELLAAGGWTITSTIKNEQCFLYEYDSRQRMIIKKVPGAGEVWMVYDARDRLVMMQDSMLRAAGKWLYTRYDDLNRAVLTGLWTEGNNRTYHAAQAQSSTNYPAPGSSYEILTETYYDNYDWVSGTGLSSTLINTSSPNVYYLIPSNSVFPYPQAIAADYRVLGVITGTKVKVLGTTGTYLYAANFYDDRGRTIQIHSTNYSGSKDTVTMQYSFSGQLLSSQVCHGKGGANAQHYVVCTQNEYDAAGRLIRVNKSFGGNPGTVLSENLYDELGQLKQKKLGRVRDEMDITSFTEEALDSLNYSYNIRGWLRGINKDFARGVTSTGWFGMELNYDFGFSQSQFNGNIAGMRWRSAGDGEKRAYGFEYDRVNRLMKADFTQYAESSWNTDAGIDYTMRGMSYDANGNILTMTQKGWMPGGSEIIDSLVYGYNTGSNKLNYVTDKTNNTESKLGDFKEMVNNSSQDYGYDGNGSLTGDNNKGISLIHYNHLNLPDSIVVTGKGIIKYRYDAAGNKLAKITIDSIAATQTQTLYSGSFVYRNDTLEYILTEEGRIRRRKPQTDMEIAREIAGDAIFHSYDYFIKDHLGNVRAVLTDEVKTDAYPAATMETAGWDIYLPYYSNVDDPELQKLAIVEISGYPADTYTDPNEYVAWLGGNGRKVGPGITLKVMAGDKFSLRVSSWYSLNQQSPGAPTTSITQAITALTNSLGSIAQNNHGSLPVEDITNSGVLDYSVGTFLDNQAGNYDGDKPKAFVNWILFDEQFNYVESGSGFEQVGEDEEFKVHEFSGLPVTKSGYLYIYVSNETVNIDVFFDNLQVTHIRGPLLEETHYYPFGLVMSGISSKALAFGGPENKRKFNKGSELQNKEFSDGSGLELYATNFRSLDPQLGRWWQIDPKPDYAQSLYSSMNNNPISFNDPLGDTVKIRHRTGFLGIFGKKTNYKYEDGRLFDNSGNEVARGDTKRFVRKAADNLDKIRAGGDVGKEMISTLQNEKDVTYIMKGSGGFKGYDPKEKLSNVIRWSPGNTSGGLDELGKTSRPAFIGLGHELGHKLERTLTGRNDFSEWYYSPGGNRSIPNAEIFALHVENLLRSENNLPLRTNYGNALEKDPITGDNLGEVIIPGTRIGMYNISFPFHAVPFHHPIY